MEKKRRFKKIDILMMVFLGTILFSAIALILARIGFHNHVDREINFNENSKVNYRVYLNPNSFFTEEYLPENMTYVASLIDYINIDFNYDLELDDNINGIFNYYIKGTVSANPTNSDSSYYTKEYILSDTKTINVENESNLEINDSINVDYQTYNDTLVNFRNEYGVSMEGNLSIALVVESMITDPLTQETITKNKEIELNIPLTALTIEVPIETNNESTEGVLISTEIEKSGIIYLICRICSIIAYVIAGCFTLYLIYLSFMSYKMESEYHKKLRKILKVYDGIIVNVQSKPNIENKNILTVASFEELIDAHGEIRNPINFIKEKDGATFILVADSIIYKYKLERALFSNNIEDKK